MAIVNDIKKNLANQGLNAKQKINLQKQLASAQNPQKAVPIKTAAPTSPLVQNTTPKPTVTNPTVPGAAIDKVTQPTTPASQVTQPTQPTQPTPTTDQPTQQPGQSTMGGFDEQSLLSAGISQDQINKAKAILNPVLQSQQNQLENAGEYKDLVLKDLDEGQKEVEALYAQQKVQKKELTEQAMQITDETAKVQGDLAAQEKQQNLFTNEQAQKQFELDQKRNEQDLQMKTDESELSYRRMLGSQLGAAFSTEGVYRYIQVQRQGQEMISDLRSQTAIGKAEFAFKAQDIETKYINSMKEISLDRRAQSFALLSDLNSQLDDIDSKVLSTKEEKRQAARDVVKDYYDKLNEVDSSTAELTSTAVNSLFTEKKELEKEKLEKESVDTQMSSALGYFANKYGQPIGVREGEAPKPWVGEFNEGLSKQFGHLVDAKGNAILGTDGKKITYTDFSIKEHESALSAFLGGTATGYEKASLNGSVGANNYLVNAVKAGSKGGQCGTFVRTRFTTEPGWEGVCGNWGKAGYSSGAACSKGEKQKMVNKRGFKVGQGVPKTGDIAIFTGPGYGSVGHYAIISEISADGKKGRLTESNLDLKGTVRTDRWISLADKGLYGFFTPNHKPEVKAAQPKLAPEGADASEGDDEPNIPEGIKQLKELRISSPETFEQLIKDASPADIMQLQKYRVFDGGKGDAPQFDILQYKGNPKAWAALPEETRKAFESTYTKDQINDIVVKGKTVEESGAKGIDPDLNIKLKGLVKPIADDLRDIDLQGSAFKNITADKEDPYTDQTLVYTFNKLLDPGSVVKESEYATALKNAGWFGQFQGELSKADGKSLLSKDVRKKLLDEMNRIYDEKRKLYVEALKENRDFIANQEIDPNKIFPFENYIKGGATSSGNKGFMGLGNFFGGGNTSATNDADGLLNELYGDSTSKDETDDILADLYN